MDQEIQELNEKIDELRVIVEENTRMTASLYRRARFSMLISGIKWFIIIGAAVGAFYYVQPAVDSLMQTYSAITGAEGGSSPNFMNFFKSF